MIDFTQSKQNAQQLIQRFIDNEEQPNFMEYLCFRQCYVDGEFFGYGAEYVVKNFRIYVGIFDTINVEVSGNLNLKQVCKCDLACQGEDFISEAKRQGVDFTMKEGRLYLIKVQEKQTEVEYDKYSYYSRRASKSAN